MSQKTSAALADYIEELELFHNVLSTTLIISENQGGIDTDGRGIRGMKIFTRQTLTSMSLVLLLPNATKSESLGHLWDVCSIASLTRNLIEGYLALNYFGIEIISESEADLRFQLLQLHKNIEWYNIRKSELDEIEEGKFIEVINSQKEKVRQHEYISYLSDNQRRKALQWNEMYKTKSDFKKELPICKDLTKIYRHLSNLSHPLPLSIERIDNERGRGLGSEPDVNLCLVCVMLARKYLAATVIGITNHFEKELAIPFRKELELILPLVTKGF